MSGGVCRFAPTASGGAHPGTLLAGMLCWLDARTAGDRLLLRLEDLDPERCARAHGEALLADMAWFGLDWDAVEWQSEAGAGHAAALDRLAAAGRLYPSRLSRRELAAIGRRAPDGGWAYDNRERAAALPPGGWRTAGLPLRCRLDDGVVAVRDLGGEDLSQDVAAVAGDPLVLRRDGVPTYALAVVVDDARAGVTRVVRGRDIAPGTATQVALQRLLGLPTPAYRHHLLVRERGAAGKLSKSHGAVDAARLRAAGATAPALCGMLAALAGLGDGAPCRPRDLLAGFAWEGVRRDDAVVQVADDGLLAASA